MKDQRVKLPTLHQGQIDVIKASSASLRQLSISPDFATKTSAKRKAVRCGRRWGKALALDTPLPTPTGWTTMGAVAEGDWVFDENGVPCRVTRATDIMLGRPCNRVVFSDGSEIIADDEHQWLSHTKACRRRDFRNTATLAKLLTTAQMRETMFVGPERNHAIPTCKPLELPEKALLIHPYVLGAWLGDGHTANAGFTCAQKDSQIVDEIRKEGQPVLHRSDINWRLSDGRMLGGVAPDSFQSRAKRLGVIGDKHIPMAYLRASFFQRLALFQGLMDTDGYTDHKGTCEYCTILPNLAEQVLELALSLGIRAYMRKHKSLYAGKICTPHFRLRFTTALPVFRLERKAQALRGRKALFRIDYRFIKSITPIDSVPVRCIAVDSPSHLYLASKSFIPTHNTALDQVWLGDGAIKGFPNAIFAPDYKRMSEVFEEVKATLAPVTIKRGGANKTDGVIRLITGGRIDFWTLEDENAGRSRKYKRVVVDEGGFTKPNMMQVWERSIEPTLLDLNGDCMVTSNTNGIDPENFLWQICNEPKYGFIEVHQPTWANPHVPGRLFEHQMSTKMLLDNPEHAALEAQLDAAHEARRAAFYEDLKARTHPLVFAQEYEAEFVDWSGAAFFTTDKWLGRDGLPVPDPAHVDTVFAVIDSAVKAGTNNDGTAVIYFARNKYAGTPLFILDWDIIQIEGANLYPWLEGVYANLAIMAKRYGAREGIRGVWVEDKASGSILLQQARKLRSDVYPIGGQWLTYGKDERALAVSSYHYQGTTKILRCAYDKVTLYKGTHRNHLIGQIAGFRIGDKDAARRADDLLDSYVHGLELAFGDGKRTG